MKYTCRGGRKGTHIIRKQAYDTDEQHQRRNHNSIISVTIARNVEYSRTGTERERVVSNRDLREPSKFFENGLKNDSHSFRVFEATPVH